MPDLKKVQSLKFKIQNYCGFTLIEILIAVAIISLVGTFSLPNLKKYNNRQLVKNAASELRSTLQNASSKVNSNIKCNDTKASIAWKVVFKNTTPLQYDLIANCDDGTLATQLQNAPLPSSVIIAAAGITCSPFGSSASVDLIFEKKGFSYNCSGAGVTQGPFFIKLQDNVDISQFETINITAGGIISE